MELLAMVVLFAPVVWLLERTNRRTRDLPRAPLGADAESSAAATYRRQIAELRLLAAQAEVSAGDHVVGRAPARDVRPVAASTPTPAPRARRVARPSPARSAAAVLH